MQTLYEDLCQIISLANERFLVHQMFRKVPEALSALFRTEHYEPRFWRISALYPMMAFSLQRLFCEVSK